MQDVCQVGNTHLEFPYAACVTARQQSSHTFLQYPYKFVAFFHYVMSCTCIQIQHQHSTIYEDKYTVGSTATHDTYLFFPNRVLLLLLLLYPCNSTALFPNHGIFISINNKYFLSVSFAWWFVTDGLRYLFAPHLSSHPNQSRFPFDWFAFIFWWIKC